jgi:hypothetical protein
MLRVALLYEQLYSKPTTLSRLQTSLFQYGSLWGHLGNPLAFRHPATMGIIVIMKVSFCLALSMLLSVNSWSENKAALED